MGLVSRVKLQGVNMAACAHRTVDCALARRKGVADRQGVTETVFFFFLKSHRHNSMKLF